MNPFKPTVFRFVLLLINLLIFSCVFSQKQASDLAILYDSTKVYYKAGYYNKAINDLNKVLEQKKALDADNDPHYYKIFNRLGIIYRKKGNFSKAIDYYNKAVEYSPNELIASIINGNVAHIHTFMGDYDKAISAHKNTLTLLQQSDFKDKYRRIANVYHNLGFTYYNAKRFELSLEYALKGVVFSEKNNISIDSDSYYNAALAYENLDSLDKADAYFKKAIEKCTQNSGKDYYTTGMAHLNYGEFFLKVNKLDKSKYHISKAYSIFSKILSNKHLYMSYCCENLGLLQSKQQNYKQALHYYQKALVAKINDFNDTCIYSNPKANAFADLELIEILKYKALDLQSLATRQNKEQNLHAALSTLKLAVVFIEKLKTGYLYENSKLKLAEQEHQTYLSIIDIAYSLYEISGNDQYAQTAFRYSELSKYSLLREIKNEEQSRILAGIPDSIRNNEHEVKQEIGALRKRIEQVKRSVEPDKAEIDKHNKKIFDLMQKLDQLILHLETNYPQYYKQKYSTETISIKQLQKSIDKNDAIIEYVLGDSTLYSFVVTQDTFLIKKQQADSSFYSSLNFYSKALHSPYTSSYSLYRKSAYKLYRYLISPFNNVLKGKNLLIIPDDKISTISFDALICKPYLATDKLNYKKEAYLLRKHPIAYAYSATLYTSNTKSKNSKSPRFLGLAPGYKNSKDSLRHIPLGLENMRKLAFITFGKSLTGTRATEKEFKQQCGKYDIIHFYAHGFEDTLNPTNSKLILSNPIDTLNDGYLHAWEVYNMHLNTEMVVLGSCYSGAGKLSKGEGVMSISRSFSYAGTKSVIVSLWLAFHKPANIIFNTFYFNLFKAQRKDKALQLAKLKYLENTNSILAHPRFWSGIVIYGNQKPIYKYWYLKRIIVLLGIVLLVWLIVKYKSKSRFF